MRLHEADTHLEWTRLHLATGGTAAARSHLDRARDLVRACGYGRREREVAWLESRLSGETREVLEDIRRRRSFRPAAADAPESSSLLREDRDR